jgi:hypothetical protein
MGFLFRRHPETGVVSVFQITFCPIGFHCAERVRFPKNVSALNARNGFKVPCVYQFRTPALGHEFRDLAHFPAIWK